MSVGNKKEEGRKGHCWNRPSHCEEIKLDSTGCHLVTHYHYLSFHRFTGGGLFISGVRTVRLTQTHCILSSSITFTSPALFPPDDFFQYEIIYSLYAAPSKDAKTQLFKCLRVKTSIYGNPRDSDGPFCAYRANILNMILVRSAEDSKPAKYWPITSISSQHCLGR